MRCFPRVSVVLEGGFRPRVERRSDRAPRGTRLSFADRSFDDASLSDRRSGARGRQKRDRVHYRDAKYAEVIVGVDPDPANNEKITAWTKDYWSALHPFSAGGAYVNFMMEEGHDRVKDSYRDNYARLVEIKTKYDPANLFRVNQNIRPVTAS